MVSCADFDFVVECSRWLCTAKRSGFANCFLTQHDIKQCMQTRELAHSQCCHVGCLQVEQIGEAKVLFKMREFTTLLKVDEDARNPEELRTGFTLIRSVRPCTLFTLEGRTSLHVKSVEVLICWDCKCHILSSPGGHCHKCTVTDATRILQSSGLLI